MISADITHSKWRRKVFFRHKKWYNKETEEDVKNRILGKDGQEKYIYLKSDVIHKLNSTKEIAKHFTYRDEWGDEFLPIDVQSWSKLNIETQKELAEGIEYAKETFGLKAYPNQIKTGNYLITELTLRKDASLRSPCP